MNRVRLGVAQLASVVASADADPRPANLEAAMRAIRVLAAEGAQIVVFGECFLTGYMSGRSAARHAIGESIHDQYVARLAVAAADHDVHIVMGAVTDKGPYPGSVYNSALLIGPHELVGVYNKVHLATVETEAGVAAIERAWFAPGSSLPVFGTPHGVLGLEICYDVFFPESARTLAMQGAELIINLSAPYTDPANEERWDHLLYARAMENSVPYLHASIVGDQGDASFFGGSRLVGPTGATLAEAPRHEEALVVMELDRTLIRAARTELNPFANRRPEIYSPSLDHR
ncbi:carbon-nitrogen hydrolase family protein [Nonomuraea lactucae]|uniref:carbon-nitrogen hydrolase family protein n=1 Tax=Nonomuraea lactucae TaxID=2249762 RepID=UPI000DE27F2A|nr:carbon-nitrogen hydrolase family protein [Nonomuraea lactucae]